MHARPAPPRYFPVEASPYRMKSGLRPFGTDFGNGAVDGHFFQIDDEADRYRSAKRHTPKGRTGVRASTPAEGHAHAAVLDWIRATWNEEHPDDTLPPLPHRLHDAYEAVSRHAQEDLAVLFREADTTGVAIAVFVDFPSGWRPERILGTSFTEIHDPVPDFAHDPGQVDSMVTSMIHRGPYVRFVWTLSADDALDHHPEEGGRQPWTNAARGWLRVERQVTVPFPSVRASLFLIRTYLYPFERLTLEERTQLRDAIRAMPGAIARYKSLEGQPRAVAQRLLVD